MIAGQARSDTAHLLSIFNRDLGLSDEDLSRVLAAPPRMIERWHSGLVAPGPVSADRIGQLRAIHERLYSLFEAHDALDWLRAPNEQLHWLTPIASLVAGNFAAVNAAIDQIGFRSRR